MEEQPTDSARSTLRSAIFKFPTNSTSTFASGLYDWVLELPENSHILKAVITQNTWDAYMEKEYNKLPPVFPQKKNRSKTKKELKKLKVREKREFEKSLPKYATKNKKNLRF